MKWLNRIAQGFSPGDHGPSENRPEGATEHYLPPRSVTVSNALAADPCAQPICRSPLQGDAVLQFRGDHLLEFDDVSRELADTFRQFLRGHRILVERETERFLVE